MSQFRLQITGCLLFSILIGGFPDIITDIEGNNINLKELTSQKTVAVITMKSPDCPVCQTQILRIKQNFDRLAVCNVTFLVLAPTPIEKLYLTKEMTQFPFPFIADHDLKIARSLDLLLSETEISPAILVLNNKLGIEWIQKGREYGYYGDTELMIHLKCDGWLNKLIKKFKALIN